jgi:hypothetical protein
LQISPATGLAQPAPSAVPPALPVVGPAVPIEPARRVTANREGGRGDLQARPPPQRSHSSTHARGRLIDVFV